MSKMTCCSVTFVSCEYNTEYDTLHKCVILHLILEGEGVVEGNGDGRKWWGEGVVESDGGGREGRGMMEGGRRGGE